MRSRLVAGVMNVYGRLEGFIVRWAVGGMEGYVILRMKIFGGDFESEGYRKEGVDYWCYVPASSYCEGAILQRQ